MQATAAWLCFGVGVNNFATGRMRSAAITERLADEPNISIVRSFGATGNLLVEGSVSSSQIVDRLGALTPAHEWAVVPVERVAGYVEEIREAPLPEPVAGVRWTRGIALPIESPERSALNDTPRAHLRWTSDRAAVAVLKRDILNDLGRLDPTRRLGGWGGVSADIRRQVGGVWTARSLRTVSGLLKRAR